MQKQTNRRVAPRCRFVSASRHATASAHTLALASARCARRGALWACLGSPGEGATLCTKPVRAGPRYATLDSINRESDFRDAHAYSPAYRGAFARGSRRGRTAHARAALLSAYKRDTVLSCITYTRSRLVLAFCRSTFASTFELRSGAPDHISLPGGSAGSAWRRHVVSMTLSVSCGVRVLACADTGRAARAAEAFDLLSGRAWPLDPARATPPRAHGAAPLPRCVSGRSR